MNTFKKVPFILMLMLLSISCSDMQVFRMDVLKPGYVVVPSQKNNILIVDNTGVQPKNAGHEIKVSFRAVGDTAFNLEPLSGMLIHSLTNYLLKEGFYKNIRVMNRKDMVPGKLEEDDYHRSGRLSSSKIMQISQDTSIHLLFSLDRLLTRTTTNTYYTGEYYRATRDVWVNTVWRVYDLDDDSLVVQFQYNDSLYWEKFSPNPYMVSKMLPEMDDVLPEIGDVIAEHLNTLLGPHWVTEKRVYFSTGSYRMKMAADLVRKDMIDDAAELWKTVYKKGYFRSNYRAAINMMFFEEVKGNPKEALIWEKHAEDAMLICPIGGADYDRELLRQWKAMLLDRIKEFEKLKIYFDGGLN